MLGHAVVCRFVVLCIYMLVAFLSNNSGSMTSHYWGQRIIRPFTDDIAASSSADATALALFYRHKTLFASCRVTGNSLIVAQTTLTPNSNKK